MDRLYYFDEFIGGNESNTMVGGSFAEYIDRKTGKIRKDKHLELQHRLKKYSTANDVIREHGSNSAIVDLWGALNPELDTRHSTHRARSELLRAQLQDQSIPLLASHLATVSPPLGPPIPIVPKYERQVRLLNRNVPREIRMYATANGLNAEELYNSSEYRDPEEGWVDYTPAWLQSRKIYSDKITVRDPQTGKKSVGYTELHADPHERYQYRNKPGAKVKAGRVKFI
jgi:hypothetical protein